MKPVALLVQALQLWVVVVAELRVGAREEGAGEEEKWLEVEAACRCNEKRARRRPGADKPCGSWLPLLLVPTQRPPRGCSSGEGAYFWLKFSFEGRVTPVCLFREKVRFGLRRGR